jgi:hypothetical protein
MSAPIWLAGLLIDLWHGDLRLVKTQNLQRLLIAGLTLIYAVSSSWSLVRNLVAPTDNGYFAMRSYLLTQIPGDVVIESWEWELSIDTPQPFHHPPTRVTNAFTMSVWSGAPLPTHLYVVPENADYLLTGPFSAWTGIYMETLASGAEPVIRFNEYALYRLSKPGAP